VLDRFLGELKRRNVLRIGGVYAVTAWGLFQVAKTVFETLDLPRWASALVLVLLTLGFPISLVVAWAFERGPDGGVQRTTPAEPDARPRAGLVDLLLLGAIVVVVAIAGAQFTGFLAGSGGRATVLGSRAPEKSVAVLPFANFSPVKDAEYFADGLTEEVINSLAQIPDLKVAGRTSAFYFKDKNEDLREIGRRLGVAHVVEGSVRRDGENLRVTAQLISVKDGFHLWSKTYDRKMDDALAIQTEIADAVAEALKTRLASDVQTAGRIRDPEAFQLQLTSRAHLRRWGLEELQTARAGFERLTAMEPDNASAYAGLAQATILLAQNYLALDFDEARRVSEAAVQRALQIDPRSVDAWLARAYIERILTVRSGEERHQKQMGAAALQAVRLDPRNAEALAIYANYLGNAGDPAQAVAYGKKALAIDPLNRVSQMALGMQLVRLDRLDEAARRYRSVIELYPDFDDAKQALGALLVEQGKLAEAEAWYRSGGGADGRDTAAAIRLAAIYANLGLQSDADAALDAVKSPPPAARVARIARLALDGDYGRAQAYAEAQHAADPDPFWTSAVVITSVTERQPQKALAVLRRSAPGVFLPEPQVAATDLDLPVYAAYAIGAAGDPAQARRILEKLLSVTAPRPGQRQMADFRVARARAYAGLGQVDQAIAELSQAEAQGWRDLFNLSDYVWLDRHPSMAVLHEDPRFKALVARIRADLARQRQALLAQRGRPAA
jgi:TolB-like protein/Tfp pilus assembly protein PilF